MQTSLWCLRLHSPFSVRQTRRNQRSQPDMGRRQQRPADSSAAILAQLVEVETERRRSFRDAWVLNRLDARADCIWRRPHRPVKVAVAAFDARKLLGPSLSNEADVGSIEDCRNVQRHAAVRAERHVQSVLRLLHCKQVLWLRQPV